MGAVLDDLAFVDHNDRVGISDGAQPVRDYNYCLGDFWVLENLVEGLLYLMLGLGVKGAGCLVKEEDLGLPDQCSSNRNPLLLSSRQLDSSLSNHRLITLWQRVYKFISIGYSRCFFNTNLIPVFRTYTKTDIIFDRPTKNKCFLTD